MLSNLVEHLVEQLRRWWFDVAAAAGLIAESAGLGLRSLFFFARVVASTAIDGASTV